MIDYADNLSLIIGSKEDNICERFQLFNDEIEKEFISSNTASCNAENFSTNMEDAAKALHEKLISVISSNPPSFYIRDQGYCVDVEWESGISMTNVGVEEASDIAMKVAKAISLHYTTVINDQLSEDKFRSSQREDEADNKDFLLLSEILRSCKNLIRWHRFQLANLSPTQKKRAISSWGAVDRLCSIGMIRLYVALLNLNSYKNYENKVGGSNGEESHNVAREALARNASVAVFHATYGPAAKTSSVVQKGLAYLVEPCSDFNWIATLSGLIMSTHSVPVMLSLLRNVHNIVWSAPKITSKLNKAFEAVEDDLGNPTVNGNSSTSTTVNILSVLVSLLAWTLRSKPEFPGYDSCDRRSELATEILRILFAIRSNGAVITKNLEDSNPDVMTQLGILLVDILHLSNKDKRAYECKLAVLALLMDPPCTYCQYLVVNKAIDPLLTILWLQLNDLLVVNGGSVRGESNAASILPVLVVLNKLSQFNNTIKTHVKEYIFPSNAEAAPGLITVPDYCEGKLNTSVTGGKNVKPINAPPGTMRWKLIRLMTSIDSNVKRCASELLWTLCDGNSKEYVTRTGFGNAVHMLGIKGIVQIPE